MLDPILRSRIKECCRRHYEVFISAFLSIIFASFMSQGKGIDSLLWSWSLITSSILLVRFIFILRFNRLDDEQIRVSHIHQFTTIMFVWGMTWCVGTLLFFPLLDIPQQAAWFAMFMVMVAASASSHSVYMPAFYAFAIPYFFAVLWMVAIEYPSPFHFNALIFVLMMITQVGAAKKGNSMMLESLRLRYENLDLIDALKQQRNEAEKASAAKSKFLAAASHDLRQPLQALTLFTEALQDKLDDPEHARKIISKINESLEALQQLFNALLDISRLDAGTLPCEKQHIEADQVFSKLKNEFNWAAEQKQLRLNWQVPPCVLFTDPTLLQLVLRNLIANAIRYTHQGEVSVSVVQEAHQIRMDVADTGIGISKQHKDYVFEEFVQLHNPERDRNKGLGLGLSIVKRVAKLIDCQVEMTSEEGKGTRFSLVVEAGQDDQVQLDIEGMMGAINITDAMIVVIDDEEIILEAMETLLTGWGYDVVLARDLHQAEILLDSAHYSPDCIIADYRLRDNKTGLQAIAQLRKHYGDEIPAMIISGDIDPTRLQDVESCGLVMLHKPIQPARLRSFLSKQLQH